jgi:hypothetical protein
LHRKRISKIIILRKKKLFLKQNKKVSETDADELYSRAIAKQKNRENMKISGNRQRLEQKRVE